MTSQGILNLSQTISRQRRIRMKRKKKSSPSFCAISIHEGWVKQKLMWIIIAHFLIQRENGDDSEKGENKLY